jgi:hypothetical protein
MCVRRYCCTLHIELIAASLGYPKASCLNQSIVVLRTESVVFPLGQRGQIDARAQRG